MPPTAIASVAASRIVSVIDDMALPALASFHPREISRVARVLEGRGSNPVYP